MMAASAVPVEHLIHLDWHKLITFSHGRRNFFSSLYDIILLCVGLCLQYQETLIFTDPAKYCSNARPRIGSNPGRFRKTLTSTWSAKLVTQGAMLVAPMSTKSLTLPQKEFKDESSLVISLQKFYSVKQERKNIPIGWRGGHTRSTKSFA